MAKIYFYQVKEKGMPIEQVPARWREATQALLDEAAAVTE